MPIVFAPIKIKRGLKSSFPTLQIGELGLATDTKEVYFGTSSGNKRIATEDDITYLDDEIKKKPYWLKADRQFSYSISFSLDHHKEDKQLYGEYSFVIT